MRSPLARSSATRPAWLEETAWTPGGNPEARAGTPVLSPRWIAEDGRSSWLVWNEGQLQSGRDPEREKPS